MEEPGHSLHGGCVWKAQKDFLVNITYCTRALQTHKHTKAKTHPPKRSETKTQQEQYSICGPMQRGVIGVLHWRNQTATKQENGPAQEGQWLRTTISSVSSFEGQRTFISWPKCTHFGWRRQLVWEREAIHVNIECPSLNRGGGLRYYMSLFIMLPFQKIRTIHTWVEMDCRNRFFTQTPPSFVHLTSLFRPGESETNMEDISGIFYQLSSDWRSY